jgi:hypothetical protein
VFLVPLAFASPSTPEAHGPSGSALTFDTTGEPGATDDTGALVSAASSPGAKASAHAGKSAGAPGVLSPTASTVTTSPAPGRTTSPPAGQPPAGFAPNTMQAESAAVSAPWQTDTKPTCTAGTPVVRTGKWTEYSNKPGAITFTVSVPTAGSYRLTIYSVVSLRSGGTRKAEITVNNASVTSPDFPEGCLLAPSIVVSLKQGDNKILFTNQNARGPSIDRIEISKP